jgi:hypothetical protein
MIEWVATRREEREWSVYTHSRVGCVALNEEMILKERVWGGRCLQDHRVGAWLLLVRCFPSWEIWIRRRTPKR